MVASDTVVGLVGAGILLVALVGVFVYESRQGGIEAPELENADYMLTGKGTVTSTAQSGAVGQVCQPQTMCVPANTHVEIEITGLPDVGSMKYVVFLTGGGGTYNAGTLSKSGEKWSINKDDPVDQSARTTVLISLEKTATVTAPSGFTVMSFPKGNVPAAPEDVWLGETGNHTLSLTPSGNQLNVSAAIDDVPDKNGYEYHGWLVKEDENGKTYTHVGKFEHPAGPDEHATGKEDLVLARNVNGTSADYTEFWVTVEGGAIGSQPGPAVILAKYNEYEGSAAEA